MYNLECVSEKPSDGRSRTCEAVWKSLHGVLGGHHILKVRIMSKEETQFKKGRSGNPKGRPKGKVMTDSTLRRTLARGDAQALETIMGIIDNDSVKDLNLKFRASTAWLNYSFQIRASDLKKQLAKKSDDEYQESEVDDVTATPVVSLTAV